MKKIYGVLFFVSSFTFAATGQWQTWEVPNVLAKTLVENKKEFSDIQWDGKEISDLDTDKTRCEVKVFRPNLLEPEVATQGNEIRCQVQSSQGETSALVLGLNQVPIRAWGNRAEEAYRTRENLPQNFQIRNHDLNLKLYKLLSKALEKDASVVGMTLCDPVAGVDCLNALTIEKQSEETYKSAHFFCNVDTLSQKVYSTRCAFLYPEE